MDKSALFNGLKSLMLEYSIAKFVDDDDFTPDNYLREAQKYILGQREKNLRHEFLDTLNFVERRKFSEFLHDVVVYYNDEAIRLIRDATTVRQNLNQQNIEASRNDFQSNIPTALDDFENIRGSSSKELAFDTNETSHTGQTPLQLRASSSKELAFDTNVNVNETSHTGQTPLQLRDSSSANNAFERYSLLLHNDDLNLGDINANPLPDDELNLPSPGHSDHQNNDIVDEFDEKENNMNKIKELLNRINLNVDESNNRSTFVRRRRTNTPRISSEQRGRMPPRRPIVPNSKPRYRIRQHVYSNLNANMDIFDEYNERYIPFLNTEFEYLKIFDSTTMETIAPYTTEAENDNFMPQIPDDDINIENFEPEPEIDSVQQFSINHLLHNYYSNNNFFDELINRNTNPNITDDNTEHIAENVAESMQQKNDNIGVVRPITCRAFYGSNVSPVQELNRRPQNLVVSVTNLPPIPLDVLRQSYNSPANRIFSPGQRNFTDILRPRDSNIDYAIQITTPNRKKRRRKIIRRNQSVEESENSEDERRHIEEFKELQEIFIKYHGEKYQDRPKFDFNCYTELLYNREEIISSLDVFKLLITSHGQPILRSDIFPVDISERQIFYRRSAVKSLTELQIAEVLNEFDSEEKFDDMNFLAIQLRKPTV